MSHARTAKVATAGFLSQLYTSPLPRCRPAVLLAAYSALLHKPRHGRCTAAYVAAHSTLCAIPVYTLQNMPAHMSRHATLRTVVAATT